MTSLGGLGTLGVGARNLPAAPGPVPFMKQELK